MFAGEGTTLQALKVKLMISMKKREAIANTPWLNDNYYHFMVMWFEKSPFIERELISYCLTRSSRKLQTANGLGTLHRERASKIVALLEKPRDGGKYYCDLTGSQVRMRLRKITHQHVTKESGDTDVKA